jgi:prepilin-type N-terminal cleavage/methylation domain-containing protein
MKNIADKTGLTLIEVVVSIGIFAVIMAALSLLFVSLYKQQGADIGLMERTHAANAAIDKMGKELREANRGENGNFAIANAGANSLVFYSDVDNDNLTERVAYVLQGTDLKRTVVEPGSDFSYSASGTTTVLCGNVRNGTNPIFKYYDENYDGSGDSLPLPVEVLKVRVVGIFLDLNSSGISSYPLHIETKIQLRNLK